MAGNTNKNLREQYAEDKRKELGYPDLTDPKTFAQWVMDIDLKDVKENPEKYKPHFLPGSKPYYDISGEPRDRWQQIQVLVNSNNNDNPNSNSNSNSNNKMSGTNADNNTKTGTNGGSQPKVYSGTQAQFAAGKLLNEWEKSKKKYQGAFDSKNKELADNLGVNTKRGTYDNNGYLNFDLMNRDIKEAGKDVEYSEKANKKYQGLLESIDNYKGLLKALKTGTKNGFNSLDLSQLRETESMLKDRIAYFEGGLNFIKEHPEMFDDAWKERNAENLEDTRKKLEDLYGQASVIRKNIQEGEDWQNLIGKMGKFQTDFADTIGIELDEFGNYAEKSGSKVNQYQYETAKTVMERINRAMADGNITKEEIGDLAKLEKMVDDIAKNERSLDPNITDAEERLENAKARRGYFIMDQIKSWIVFIMSMETGNPQMAYSALEMFNKKIADSEAGYRENRMKAFSNNEMKEITGDADALYNTKQLMSELEKEKFFYGLKEDEKAQTVRQFERAFEEYQNYIQNGGKEEFAGWYLSQQDNGSGWAGAIKSIIGGAALNKPLLDKIYNVLSGEDTGEGNEGSEGSGSKGGKTGMLDNNSPLINFAPVGQGKTSDTIKNLLTSSKGASEEEGIAKKRGLEKQNIVASIKGQPTGAPQTQPTGKASGWGNNIA